MCLQSALQAEKDKASKESLKLKAEVSTLTAKVETLSNSMKQLKKSEAELQVKGVYFLPTQHFDKIFCSISLAKLKEP